MRNLPEFFLPVEKGHGSAFAAYLWGHADIPYKIIIFHKVKKLVDKIDPETRKPMLDREGKVVKEEKEITVPAFKVITVFDISQTEGKEFPDLSVKPLLADVEQYEDFFAALEKASPVPIAFEQSHKRRKWVFQFDRQAYCNQRGRE